MLMWEGYYSDAYLGVNSSHRVKIDELTDENRALRTLKTNMQTTKSVYTQSVSKKDNLRDYTSESNKIMNVISREGYSYASVLHQKMQSVSKVPTDIARAYEQYVINITKVCEEIDVMVERNNMTITHHENLIAQERSTGYQKLVDEENKKKEGK